MKTRALSTKELMTLFNYCAANMSKQIFFTSCILLLTVPILLFANTDGPEGGLDYEILSPIRFGSISELIVGILNFVLVIAVPIIVFFLILAGFKYVTARGNPADIQTANRSLLYALIGGVMILGSVALSEIIKNLVESF
jgi:hypothetical protein